MLHPDSFDQAFLRGDQASDLLAGKMGDSAAFLADHNITMVTVWPGDHVDPAVVTKLQRQLAPDFVYEDCRGAKPAADAPQAGVFVHRALVAPDPGRPFPSGASADK